MSEERDDRDLVTLTAQRLALQEQSAHALRRRLRQHDEKLAVEVFWDAADDSFLITANAGREPWSSQKRTELSVPDAVLSRMVCAGFGRLLDGLSFVLREQLGLEQKRTTNRSDAGDGWIETTRGGYDPRVLAAGAELRAVLRAHELDARDAALASIRESAGSLDLGRERATLDAVHDQVKR